MVRLATFTGAAAITLCGALATPVLASPSPVAGPTRAAVLADRHGQWQPRQAPAAAPVTASRGARVARVALAQVGKPYRRNGRGPGGFDCSGLVAFAYRAVGMTVPHQSGALARAGRRIPISQAQPGDIVWRPGHVGIYIGNGQMVHATYPGSTVKVSPVKKMRFAVRP